MDAHQLSSAALYFMPRLESPQHHHVRTYRRSPFAFVGMNHINQILDLDLISDITLPYCGLCSVRECAFYFRPQKRLRGPHHHSLSLTSPHALFTKP
ncbi:uncharacterized protein G2W53_012241 [Senna tora]|uniref:Uncharacterized protein n=1 Tax=Senna tora TaxID=362788 RepID=A0A834WQI0_9FABA|nr:uncharacterized protein G2W53_012241 [Senna tora]